MPDAPAIVVEDVGVQFLVSHERPLTLKAAAVHLFRRPRRMETHWALRHVTFSVAQGESVAVIGANGAGKSTLLRVIAGILSPNEGRVALHGRVLPLIEMAAGFLPELSAEDNVHLNGAIFGLRRAQVRELMPQIFDFAELEEYQDVPMRVFSSGMFARLAFSLAVHLPSEILLVDEVLAVGDEKFQSKSRERLTQLIRAGRTLVLVTHDLGSAKELCGRGVVLTPGQAPVDAPFDEAVASYRSRNATA
ncbi:MAG: ABC transporter ATP-binding protein [Planctomycetota bacterium]|jgi:ABC-type polysaccharide/polyol phosphate transport system ATPase subunit